MSLRDTLEKPVSLESISRWIERETVSSCTRNPDLTHPIRESQAGKLSLPDCIRLLTHCRYCPIVLLSARYMGVQLIERAERQNAHDDYRFVGWQFSCCM